MEAAAFVGERHCARRPVEQTHADARLQSCHGTADTGGREAERLSRPNEIAGLHNGGQHADAAEQSAIERHDDLLSLQYGQRCAGSKEEIDPM